jgi:hypothetical protein
MAARDNLPTLPYAPDDPKPGRPGRALGRAAVILAAAVAFGLACYAAWYVWVLVTEGP